MQNLIIPDSVYPYLRVQKGEINHIEDRQEFEAAYNEGLQKLFNLILPHIPQGIKTSLDIGSGMGGIDILLQKEFEHDVYLLDAEQTDAVCKKHDQPFNSRSVTEKFFKENDAQLFSYLTPNDKYVGNHIDLIFSIGSYCFHYSPERYLNWVRHWCHSSTILIFDVRNAHQDWLDILRENFDEVAVLLEGKKFTKRVFKWKE